MKLWKKLLIAAIAAVILGMGATAVLILKDYSGEKIRDVNGNGFMLPSKTDLSSSEEENLTPFPILVAGKVTSEDVSSIAENIMPAIVSINATFLETGTDFFFREYQYETEGSGSGIIIGQSSNELLIVTNNHVVSDATSVQVVFCDGEKVSAAVKGTDRIYDLAVVSVNASDLKKSTIAGIRVATLGNSDNVNVGEMVIAIGNALGYGQSVTVGYISAVNREITIDGNSRLFIQTDAAINPGNSGGALLDATGAVIGINSAKNAAEAVEGMGYAIPISQAVPIINELMNREKLTEEEMGYIGISGQNISKAYSASFSIPVGIYVSSVTEDGPAAKAGLHVGDIIVGFNGRTISTMEELQTILTYTRAGSTATISIKVLESGKYIDKTLEVIVGSRTDAPQETKEPSRRQYSPGFGFGW